MKSDELEQLVRTAVHESYVNSGLEVEENDKVTISEDRWTSLITSIISMSVVCTSESMSKILPDTAN